MIGFNNAPFRAKLFANFLANVQSANTEHLDLIASSMKMNGISLSFVEQLQALRVAINLPKVFAYAVIENAMFSQELREIARHNLNPRGTPDAISLVTYEYQRAVEEKREDDLALITCYAKDFIDPHFNPTVVALYRQLSACLYELDKPEAVRRFNPSEEIFKHFMNHHLFKLTFKTMIEAERIRIIKSIEKVLSKDMSKCEKDPTIVTSLQALIEIHNSLNYAPNNLDERRTKMARGIC